MRFFALLVAFLFFVFNSQAQDSLNITRLSQFDSGGMDLVKVDDYLYVANQDSGLGILDVSDPTNPIQFPDYPMPFTTIGLAYYDNHLYLACMDSGYFVLDATNRTDLQEVCRIATRNTAFDVAIRDSILYLADYRAGLRIFDVSDLQQIEEIGHYDPGLVAAFTTLVDDYAFVSTMFANLRTVNISDPTNPFQISMIRSSTAFRVAGNFPLIYVADGNSGIRLINLTEPALPEQVSILDTPGFSSDVALMDGLVVIADGRTGGLRVVDYSDPDNPVTLGYYITDWAVEELLIGEDGIIYSNGGIFKYTPGEDVKQTGNDRVVSYQLLNAYPNPFNSSMTLKFGSDKPTLMRMEVYNPLGRRMTELIPARMVQAGQYSTVWNATGVPAGEYIIRLQSGGRIESIPVTLVK